MGLILTKRNTRKMTTEEYLVEMMEDIELSPGEPPPTQPLIEADTLASAAAIEVDQPDENENRSSKLGNDERSISKASMMVMAFIIALFVYISLIPIVSLSISSQGSVAYEVHSGIGWIPLVIVVAAFLRSRKSRRDACSTGAAFLYGICPYRRDTLRRSATEWLARETWEIICETTRDILDSAISGLKVLCMLIAVSTTWSAACFLSYILLRPILRLIGKLLAWELLRLLEALGYIKEWDVEGAFFVECFTSPEGGMSWCDDFQGVVQTASTVVLLLAISAIMLAMRLLLSSVDIFGEQSYYLQCARDEMNKRQLVVV